MIELPTNQVSLLQQAITALEAQRATLGDAVVDASLVVLRAQLIQAEAALQPREEYGAPRLVACLSVSLLTRDNNSYQGRRILDFSFNVIVEVIRQYNGVVQGVGDSGIVALFSGGADDPTRAAYAALAIRQKLQEYSNELEDVGEGAISYRAGLNIGRLAMSADNGPIIGDTMTLDLAEYLSQTAPPGSILVTQQIQSYLASDFNLQAASSVEFDYRRVTTFLLNEARKAVQVQPRNMLPEGPFIGRSDEMHAILREIEQIGEGRVIVISGESGLGKTRLLAEVHRAAPMLQWVTAHCHSAPIKPIFDAWNVLLMQFIGVQLTTQKKDIENRLREWLTEQSIPADLYDILGHQLGLVTLDNELPELLTRRRIEAWQIVLSAVVRQRPTLIVFEEAQAMDLSSLIALEALVESLQRLPIVWMIVTQPLYNQPAAATIGRLGRIGGSRYIYIRLGPIEEDKTLALLNAMIEVRNLPDPLEAGILERVQGNPLFLQHILRTLIEKHGLILDPSGQWVATAAALQDYMPETLPEVVMMRLRLLAEEAQQLLFLAAVAGDMLFPAVLKTLPTSTGLGNTLSMLYDAGLLDSGVQVIHPALRECIYNAIPKQQRASMHRQVAGALVTNCDLGGPWMAVRAYHMDKGFQIQGALDMYAQAKDWAYANSALNEVSEILGAMLELINERDMPEQVASLLVEQQDILYELNPDDPRCKVLLNHAHQLWTELGNITEAAGALLRLAVHHAGTTVEDDYYYDAQTLLENEDPRHPMLPNVYLRRALYLADHRRMGSAQKAEEFFERARTLALQLQDVSTLSHIHFEMGLYLRDHHQLTEALAAFQQALSYLSQLDEVSPDERVLTCNYLADLYYHLGHPAKGEYYAVEAVANAPHTSEIIQVLPYVTLSECYASQARWQEAIQVILDAPAEYAPAEMPLRFWMGRWTFEEGNTLAGLEVMRTAVPAENLECMMLFIDYLLDGNFVEEASIRLHQLVQSGRVNDTGATTFPTQAYYDRLRGRLAAANKDFVRATSLLDRAMHQFAREGFVYLSLSTRRTYAASLLARNGPNDAQAARILLDEAFADCKKLSVHAETRRLQTMMRQFWPDSAPR